MVGGAVARTAWRTTSTRTHPLLSAALLHLFRREGGDAKKRRSYFPTDKQFLVTRNGAASVQLLPI